MIIRRLRMAHLKAEKPQCGGSMRRSSTGRLRGGRLCRGRLYRRRLGWTQRLKPRPCLGAGGGFGPVFHDELIIVDRAVANMRTLVELRDQVFLLGAAFGDAADALRNAFGDGGV